MKSGPGKSKDTASQSLNGFQRSNTVLSTNSTSMLQYTRSGTNNDKIVASSSDALVII